MPGWAGYLWCRRQEVPHPVSCVTVSVEIHRISLVLHHPTGTNQKFGALCKLPWRAKAQPSPLLVPLSHSAPGPGPLKPNSTWTKTLPSSHSDWGLCVCGYVLGCGEVMDYNSSLSSGGQRRGLETEILQPTIR